MRVVFAVVFLLAASCSREPDYYAFESRPGNGGLSVVAIWVSDSPVDRADAVTVRFASVEFGDVIRSAARDLDLLALRNGKRALLAEFAVEPGVYDALRLRLHPQGHRVRADGVEHALALADPLIEMAGPFRVGAGERLELQVDFNARLSVFESGGRWSLVPHVTVYDALVAVTITGVVLDTPGAVVSAQRGGIEIASTRAGAGGSFVIGPLAPGRYDVVATAPGKGITVLRDVTAPAAGQVIAPTAVAGGGLTGTAPSGARFARLVRGNDLIALAGIDPATGAFAFPDVPEGGYEVEWWAANGPIGARSVVFVEAGRTLRIP